MSIDQKYNLHLDPPVYFTNRVHLGVIYPARRFCVSLSCALTNAVSQRPILSSKNAQNKPHSILLVDNSDLE